MSKQCFKCAQVKTLGEFYAHPRMLDGHLNKCKECTKIDNTLHRRQNIESVREYDRHRGARNTPEYQREYRAANPEKYAAHNQVFNAIRAGRLISQPCEQCGGEQVHAHHDDYSKPLDVRWLCPVHHQEVHHAY